MNVTIIGTGKLARGLSARLLASGNDVTLVEHTPGKGQALVDELKGNMNGGSISVAPANTLPGEVIILAVHWVAVEPVLQQYSAQLPGKVLVDVTNPVNFQTMEPLFPGGSGAEEIARKVPAGTRVVKAFNTVFTKTLPNGKVGGIPLDVFMAGDDVEAKDLVRKLVEGSGMRAIDVGSLGRARQLEALGLLHIALQSILNTGYMSAIKVLA